ncbi:tetratricopeptide repeat protein, partial [Acinetobacter baumannii]|nr:tetratricopeptide repeat protein [Acinetobacter baumannii]
TYLGAKDTKAAIPVLEGIIERTPQDPMALNNLAWAYGQAKDPRALATAERAAKIAGDNPAIMDTLGWLLVEQGNTERGLPLLKKAAAAAPNAPEISYHLAVGLVKAGDKEGARKSLDKLLAEHKTFPQLEDARA